MLVERQDKKNKDEIGNETSFEKKPKSSKNNIFGS